VARRTQAKSQSGAKRRGPGRPPRHDVPDVEAQFPNARVIKRYGNRRLYDGKLSRCVTMEEIAEYVRKGEELRVFDGDTGEDLTKRVLTQIILEQSNAKVLELLPVEFLRRLITVRSDASQEWVARYLSMGAEFLEKQMSVSGPAQKVMSESLTAMFPWMQQWMPFEAPAHAPPNDGEERAKEEAREDALKSQLQDLQRKMADLTAQMTRPGRR
jgi:polyhydroxyalkanoate synthesis repressor PhaR